MSNIIRHKRSNTLGAVPAMNGFTEGEILLNTRDGKAFFKKVMPSSEELVELRGMRDDVRLLGQTGPQGVSETGIRQAISALNQGIIPNYFVTSLTEFVAAYNDIRASYPGGNIYITGDIIMTANLTLDMTGISVYGLGCTWRFYNGTALNPSTVYKIIITAGSPSFTGINFYGSNGSASLQLQNGTTRQVFTLNPSSTTPSKYLIFRDCQFTDIVCGISADVIHIDSPVAANASFNITFDSCRVSTHGTTAAYTGFNIIYRSASATGRILVSVHNQISSDESYTSLKYRLAMTFKDTVSFVFNTDETAWLDGESNMTIIERTNNILQALPIVGSFVPANSYLLMATGLEKNVVRVPASELMNGGGGGLGSVGITMPNIFVVANSPLTSDGVINVGLNTQTKNKVWASPENASGQPAFRKLVSADIPALDYDKYESFRAGLASDLKDIVGKNDIYQAGTKYKGISFAGGQGVSISTTDSPADETLKITISTLGSGGGGIDNTLKNTFLTADLGISANIWTDIVEIEIQEDGEYLINFQLTALKSSTGTSVIAARIVEGSQELGSAEQTVLTTLAPRASLAGHGYVSLKGIGGGKYPSIKLQMWASTTGWSAVRTTPSSLSERATQLTTVKLI
ncbi:MAG: hypothetical protein M0Q90_14360 [Bacteroidales bacterium]|nr:hypothetical protein [Bacteroidales bacterium]